MSHQSNPPNPHLGTTDTLPASSTPSPTGKPKRYPTQPPPTSTTSCKPSTTSRASPAQPRPRNSGTARLAGPPMAAPATVPLSRAPTTPSPTGRAAFAVCLTGASVCSTSRPSMSRTSQTALDRMAQLRMRSTGVLTRPTCSQSGICLVSCDLAVSVVCIGKSHRWRQHVLCIIEPRFWTDLWHILLQRAR